MTLPTVREYNLSLTNNLGLTIQLSAFMKASEQALPLVVFVHGFKGFKDWGAFPLAMRKIADAGFMVLSVNLSHSGVDNSLTEFNRLDLFRKQSFSRDVHDLYEVVRWVKSRALQKQLEQAIDLTKIAVIGHSRGGHVAAAFAAKFPQDVKALVTWAGVANYLEQWDKKMVDDWKNEGTTMVLNGRTRTYMPLDRIVYDDLLENQNELVPVKCLAKFKNPALFIHGGDDNTVDPSNAKQLLDAVASETKESFIIENTAHTFDTQHPFHGDELPDAFAKVVDKTINWLQKL